MLRPRPAHEPGQWRAALEQIAHENWALYHRHPWVLHVAAYRPPMGPHIIAKYEYELGAVEGVGLSDVEMDSRSCWATPREPREGRWRPVRLSSRPA